MKEINTMKHKSEMGRKVDIYSPSQDLFCNLDAKQTFIFMAYVITLLCVFCVWMLWSSTD